MDYYKELESLDELLGDEGLWRLPNYLPEEYVIDEAREKALNKALSLILKGRNILIVGKPGTGKTAFMLILLNELIKRGFNVGIILDGATAISHIHEERGIFLFYDDLPRMQKDALISIFRNRVKNLIATARVEEIADLRNVVGMDIWDLFEQIEIPAMQEKDLKEILIRYARREGIRILDDSAINLVCKKAQGLPVYIWQLIRELKIRKSDLTIEYAETIPQGMFDYVDDILWRVLDEHPERYEILLTLLIMTDMPKYAIHQDLYNSVFVVCKERRLGRELRLEEALFSDLLDKITRYLVRDSTTFSFRLPHDSWGDVLKGRSRGPMSGEISRINTVFPQSKRINILINAAKKVWHEVLKESGDEERKRCFIENISRVLPENIVNKILKETKVKVEYIKESLEKAEITKPLKELELPENINLKVKTLMEKFYSTKDEALLAQIVDLLKHIGDAKAMYNLGMIHYTLRKYEEAIKYFEKSMQLGEDIAILGLALANLRSGRITEALRFLGDYIAKHPEKKEIRLCLDLLERKSEE